MKTDLVQRLQQLEAVIVRRYTKTMHCTEAEALKVLHTDPDYRACYEDLIKAFVEQERETVGSRFRRWLRRTFIPARLKIILTDDRVFNYREINYYTTYFKIHAPYIKAMKARGWRTGWMWVDVPEHKVKEANQIND